MISFLKFIVGFTVLFAIIGGSCRKSGKDSTKLCRLDYSEASVSWQTPDGAPVVFGQYLCRNRGELPITVYYGLDGTEWSKSDLVPSQRHALNEILERLTKNYDMDINLEADKRILFVAKKRGIIPDHIFR